MSSVPKPRVTIVGLGLIGGSIGLALRQSEAAAAVVGHDRDRDASAQAKKLGAIDRTEWNLVSACEDSDLIILAIPLGAIAPTMEAIAPYLKPGCVVLDTASVKAPVLDWADEFLPEEVQFVGGNPVVGGHLGNLSGIESARADLFQHGLFCLVPSAGADERAVRMVANLISILEAKPMFFDAAEHDGLLAGVDQLPAILSLALLEMAIEQPTWGELRQVAGTSFETSTRFASADPSTYSDLVVHNRDNLVRWIDTFSASLASLRGVLLKEDEEEFAERFEAAMKERGKWLQDQALGIRDEGLRQELPERPNLMETLLGNFWRRSPKRE